MATLKPKEPGKMFYKCEGQKCQQNYQSQSTEKNIHKGGGDEQFLATNTALKKGLKGKLYSEEVNQEDTMNNLFIRTK